jgi:N-methylhydantoinase A
MQLNPQAAAEALRIHVAIPLAVEIERAASGMLEVAIAAMANAVRHVTLERDLDPRDFTLVAYGGASPLHAAAVARELAIYTVIIPPAPSHFSALGMLIADLCRDYVQTLFARLHTLSMEQLEA